MLDTIPKLRRGLSYLNTMKNKLWQTKPRRKRCIKQVGNEKERTMNYERKYKEALERAKRLHSEPEVTFDYRARDG